MELSQKKISTLLNKLPIEEKQILLEKLELLQEKKTREQATVNYLDFVTEMWPAFIGGEHHKIMADGERVANGELKRLIINITPDTPSQNLHPIFPAWFLGRCYENHPNCTQELAVGFGRKRNLITSLTIKKYFRVLNCQPIVKRLDAGTRTVATTSLSVLAVQ